jgi:hypothetical protein
MKIELSEENKDILMTLLNRVDLKGAEVQAFTQLIQALNTPAEEK